MNQSCRPGRLMPRHSGKLGVLPRVAPDGSRLSDRIADTLLQEILSNQIAPGDALSESRLAARFGTSRAPVREALQRLERECVVAIIPRVGARAQAFTAQSANDLYDLRIALESHALRRSALSPEELEQLHRIVAEMERAARMHKIRDVVEYDLSFHEAVCRFSGNQRLVEAWLPLRRNAKALYFFMMSRIPVDVGALPQSHKAIVGALSTGDTEHAARLLTEHIEQTRSELVDLLGRDEERTVARSPGTV